MAEAPHGTAPALEGRHIANPMSMILAVAALLEQAPEEGLRADGRLVREATLRVCASGTRTADLGGMARTEEFTAEVLSRIG
ncbi:MAG: isocitrate/isopropylmalate family dehydrogenase, partial [Candidatus Dormibacteria bacterium]